MSSKNYCFMDDRLLAAYNRDSTAFGHTCGVAFAFRVGMALPGGIFMPVADYYAVYLFRRRGIHAGIAVGVLRRYPFIPGITCQV